MELSTGNQKDFFEKIYCLDSPLAIQNKNKGEKRHFIGIRNDKEPLLILWCYQGNKGIFCQVCATSSGP